MEEFKIWDKYKKCFAKQITTFKFDRDGKVNLVVYLNKANKSREILDSEKVFCNEFTIHKSIGIKDINNKPIYADCSIVEFDFIYFETIGSQSDKVKARGYFTYNNETLGYDLMFFHNWINLMPNYLINNYLEKEDTKRASNFKIIDTIQENKLGLIKKDK